ncbi:MAG: Spy/CpxP family protein refolding chaperone [Parasphingorhabdus sp.]|jgi:Spy/CpxP family protein refolding chaperone
MSKFKMKRRTKFILITVLTLGIAGGVAAKYMHGGPEAHAARIISYAQDELNLDANQTQALTELKDTMFDMGRDLKSSRDNNVQTALSLLSEPQMDQSKALAVVQQRTSVMNERAVDLIASIANFTDKLSPVQKQQLLDKANHKVEHWRNHDH